MMTKELLNLIRPYQWIKNVFVLIPLFFGQQLTNESKWLILLYAFIAFCMASSGVYCLNDICDAESDRIHPTKCKRPIASGKISRNQGLIMMGICWMLAIGFAYLAGIGNRDKMIKSVSIIGIYIIMNVLYCVKLKNISIIDLMIVSAGFLLRLLEGGIVSDIVLSQWIIMMTFLLAIFITIAKRRDDVAMFETSGVVHRANISRYNLSFMNISLGITASVTMVCYIMYTLSEEVVARMGSKYVFFTGLFVFAGIMRYLQLAIVELKSGNPIKVMMRDRFMQICVVGWIVAFFVLLYM